MIWHPLLIAVVALDLLALIFVFYAAQTYVRVLLRWEPTSTDSQQVSLEGAVDGASIATRVGSAFFFGASLLLIIGISLLLPPLVSGAMCGTGVLTAMGGPGWRALALRGIVVMLLWVWRTLDGLNRTHHRPPVVPLVARWHLLAVPLLGLSALHTVRVIRQLDPHKPVDCCQVVYDAFRSLDAATTSLGLSDDLWLGLAAGGASLLGIMSLWGLHRSRGTRTAAVDPKGLAPALLGTALIWLPAAVLALVTVLSAYHYGVLHHHCPWCLFLPEHAAVGYPLFGALLVIALEASAFFTASRLRRAVPVLRASANRRQRRALVLLLGALLLLVGLSAGPALCWRATHGVWMH